MKGILPNNLQNDHRIFIIPICVSVEHHWILIIIELDENKMMIFNSSRNNKCDNSIEILKDHIENHFQINLNCVEMSCPQQKDGHTCGFFVILFIYRYLFNFSNRLYNVDHTKLRNSVIQILETSNFNTLNSFCVDLSSNFNYFIIIFKTIKIKKANLSFFNVMIQ